MNLTLSKFEIFFQIFAIFAISAVEHFGPRYAKTQRASGTHQLGPEEQIGRGVRPLRRLAARQPQQVHRNRPPQPRTGQNPRNQGPTHPRKQETHR